VDGHTVLPVAGTHPQLVCGDGAHFRDLQQRRDVLAQPVDGAERREGVAARQDVFALQLLAAARRELSAYFPSLASARMLLFSGNSPTNPVIR